MNPQMMQPHPYPDLDETRSSEKKPHCANCGRPVKPDTYDACKGCGSWEIEFK